MIPTTLQVLVLLAAATATHAANYFQGVAAANSKPINSGYVCRSQADWNNVASTAKASGFESIRIEGFDCNALELASSAAAANGITVLAGLYIQGTIAQSSASISNDVQLFRAAVGKYGAGRYKGLTVGNEVKDVPADIAAKVSEVRNYLHSIGITVPVSTAHDWVDIRDNPVLCSGDFVSANAHPFYDRNTAAKDAGSFLFGNVVPGLKSRCPGKPIVISETGWPSRGSTNGKASASTGDERLALNSLNCAAKNNPSVDVYAFEADDQLWKSNDWERSFGVFRKGFNFDGNDLSQC